jgi:hypothetical protein
LIAFSANVVKFCLAKLFISNGGFMIGRERIGEIYGNNGFMDCQKKSCFSEICLFPHFTSDFGCLTSQTPTAQRKLHVEKI